VIITSSVLSTVLTGQWALPLWQLLASVCAHLWQVDRWQDDHVTTWLCDELTGSLSWYWFYDSSNQSRIHATINFQTELSYLVHRWYSSSLNQIRVRTDSSSDTDRGPIWLNLDWTRSADIDHLRSDGNVAKHSAANDTHTVPLSVVYVY